MAFVPAFGVPTDARGRFHYILLAYAVCTLSPFGAARPAIHRALEQVSGTSSDAFELVAPLVILLAAVLLSQLLP